MNIPENSIINFSEFISSISDSQLSSWAANLPEDIQHSMTPDRWGDMSTWEQALSSLPVINCSKLDLKNGVFIGQSGDSSDKEIKYLEQSLMKLHPWRKGPFFINGLCIDTEWRSDWKWNRVVPHISPLGEKLVLDVGCGNGYHCLRMAGEGAARVIGIDPSVKFIYQFYAIKNYINQYFHQTKVNNQILVDVIPVKAESLPKKLKAFDTVFSMGVIYHRRSPGEHLSKLWSLVKPGGEIVLETLIIDGGPGDQLKPKGRYAKMSNVWSIPSIETVLCWMEENKFKNCRVVDISVTSVKEQRSSNWMKFESLSNFLDETNSRLTIEGYPAPIRAVFIAEA